MPKNIRRRSRKKKTDWNKRYVEYRDRFRHFIFKPYLEEGEQIVDVFHRHVIVIFKDMIKIGVVGLVIPAFLYTVFPDLWVFWAIWIGVGLLREAYVVIDWFHDVIVVTDSTMLSVKWEGFFHRTARRLEFHVVEGATTEFRGPLQLLLNYGKLVILSVGGNNTLTLVDAYRPKEAEMKVLDYRNKFMEKEQYKDSEQLKNLVTAMIRNHVVNENDVMAGLNVLQGHKSK